MLKVVHFMILLRRQSSQVTNSLDKMLKTRFCRLFRSILARLRQAPYKRSMRSITRIQRGDFRTVTVSPVSEQRYWYSLALPSRQSSITANSFCATMKAYKLSQEAATGTTGFSFSSSSSCLQPSYSSFTYLRGVGTLSFPLKSLLASLQAVVNSLLELRCFWLAISGEKGTN